MLPQQMYAFLWQFGRRKHRAWDALPAHIILQNAACINAFWVKDSVQWQTRPRMFRQGIASFTTVPPPSRDRADIAP